MSVSPLNRAKNIKHNKVKRLLRYRFDCWTKYVLFIYFQSNWLKALIDMKKVAILSDLSNLAERIGFEPMHPF